MYKPLNITESFKYLGSIISSDGSIDEDQKKVPVRIKGKVYKTAVRSTLFYGSKCWAQQKKRNENFEMGRWGNANGKVQSKHNRGSMKVTLIEGNCSKILRQWKNLKVAKLGKPSYNFL
jgi:hypothetical protein